MTSQKPYLLRAMYEWIIDNHLTPHILVDVSVEGVQVPHDFVVNGKIILNLDPDAVRNYHVDNDWISFSARFSGKPMELFIPIHAVQSIYSKENNQGMLFAEEDAPEPEPTKVKQAKRPALSIVK